MRHRKEPYLLSVFNIRSCALKETTGIMWAVKEWNRIWLGKSPEQLQQRVTTDHAPKRIKQL